MCNDDGGQLHTNPAQSTARDARDTGLQGYFASGLRHNELMHDGGRRRQEEGWSISKACRSWFESQTQTNEDMMVAGYIAQSKTAMTKQTKIPDVFTWRALTV